MKKHKLSEGSLERNDLVNLVDPLVRIDKFEAKSGTDEEVIVIAFEVFDNDPARDLDSFLERSHLDLIDVEVSPNPIENGHYLVFIEVERNEEFFDILGDIITEVSQVTGELDWRFITYLGGDNEFEFEDQEFVDSVIVNKDEYISKDEHEENKQVEGKIYDFFKESNLHDLYIDKDKIHMNGYGGSLCLEMISFGTDEYLNQANKEINESAIDLMHTSRYNTSLKSMLGEGWQIKHFSNTTLLEHPTHNTGLLVKKI